MSCSRYSLQNTFATNDKNVENARRQIAYKLDYSRPYYATINQASSVVTDMDSFPYKRFYRGDYTASYPVVFEREAGFRPVDNRCYLSACQIEKTYPDYCFQNACSVILPCNAAYSKTHGRKQFTDLATTRGCVPESP